LASGNISLKYDCFPLAEIVHDALGAVPTMCRKEVMSNFVWKVFPTGQKQPQKWGRVFGIRKGFSFN
jgi:hypothetical protein